MANPKLSLPDSPRTKVFRELDRILRSDATLRRVFGTEGGRKFLSWSGSPNDNKVLDAQSAPMLRITPMPAGADDWFSPDAQQGDLGVEVEILLRGTDADDMLNAWWAIQKAIYPEGEHEVRQAIANRLMKAGAFTGIVTFQDPAFDLQQAQNSGYIYAIGRMRIQVLMSLCP